MRTIDKLIIHCTATPEGKNFSVADIRNWHLKQGFTDIGYHFIIYLDGSVHIGRPLNKQGAHCKGQNKNSIGICYIGGVASDGKTPKDTRTEEQKQSLYALLLILKRNYPNATIHGHREFAAKDCPCFDAKYEYKNI